MPLSDAYYGEGEENDNMGEIINAISEFLNEKFGDEVTPEEIGQVLAELRSDLAIDHEIDHPFEYVKGTDYLCVCGRHVSAHPDKIQWLHKREMEDIIEFGHQVRIVFPDDVNDDGVAFAYSIGRSLHYKPEFLVTGNMQPEVLGYIINRVAEIADKIQVAPGDELDEVLEGYKVRLVAVQDLEKAEMFGVISTFGEETSALQVLWPDENGNFPGDANYEYEAEVQPVFS